MKRKFLKILLVIAGFVILIQLLALLFFEPWIEKKIFAELLKIDSDYAVKIAEVNTLFLSLGIELATIEIHPNGTKRGLNGNIESIKFKGVSLIKLLFKNDLDISEVIITNSDIQGKISFERVKHIVSSLNISIGKIFFDRIELAVHNTSTSESWTARKGFITLHNFEIQRADTFFLRDTGPLDFKAEQVIRVSPDSFYTFKADNIIFSLNSNSMQVSSFSIHPNYKDYDFTSRHEFQTDCINAEFRNVSVHDFSAEAYFKSDDLISSLVEVETMNINVFRDRRKPFHHQKKPMLQEVVYNYHGRINIDLIHIRDGNITYTEHAENAKEPGSIHFKKVDAGIHHVTNDTIYKAANAFTELKAEALLMGTAKIVFHLKAKLFDSSNTFLLSGGLSKMDVRDLNPILERNAFIHAESGIIDTMSFNLTANNIAAIGEMIMLYNILFVKAEGEHAVIPASLMQLFISTITSKRIQDANPAHGENARTGVIGYERDPEKFIFNYCFKAILSGIKSSISKNQN